MRSPLQHNLFYYLFFLAFFLTTEMYFKQDKSSELKARAHENLQGSLHEEHLAALKYIQTERANIIA
jgi:hypothetical protein